MPEVDEIRQEARRNTRAVVSSSGQRTRRVMPTLSRPSTMFDSTRLLRRLASRPASAGRRSLSRAAPRSRLACSMTTLRVSRMPAPIDNARASCLASSPSASPRRHRGHRARRCHPGSWRLLSGSGAIEHRLQAETCDRTSHGEVQDSRVRCKPDRFFDQTVVRHQKQDLCLGQVLGRSLS